MDHSSASAGNTAERRANGPRERLPEVSGKGGRFVGACAVVVLSFAGAAFVYWVHAFWACTVDDTYIFLRYASNLAEGHGPTWNPGGPRIEGYTSVLWVVWLSIPHELGVDPVLFAKVSGVAASLAALVFAYSMVLRIEAESATRHLAAAAAVLFTVCFVGFEWHSVTGMDTAPFSALLLGMCGFLALASLEPTIRHFGGIAILGLLAALTRPEGNLALAVGVAVLCVRLGSADRKRMLGTVAALFLLPAASYFLWRLVYYGQWFPLPLYVKSSGGLPGLPPVLGFVGYLAFPLGALFLLGLWRRFETLVSAGAASIAIVAFYAVPEHLMGYGWRYLAPVLPVVAVVSACGVNALLEWGHVRWRGPVSAWVVPTLASLLILGVGASMLRNARTQLWISNRMVRSIEAAHLPLGEKLASFAGTHTLAISDAGAVPYVSGWPTIDTLGLNEPHIARHGHDPAYVLSKRPDLVVVVSMKPKRFVPALVWERELHDACIEAGMRSVGSVGEANYRLWLLAKPGSRLARELSVWSDSQNRRSRRRLHRPGGER